VPEKQCYTNPERWPSSPGVKAHRERRRLYSVRLAEAEIEALIDKGYLPAPSGDEKVNKTLVREAGNIVRRPRCLIRPQEHRSPLIREHCYSSPRSDICDAVTRSNTPACANNEREH